MVLDGFDKYGTTVDFHHNHDVLVACLRAEWELTCLVGEDGVSYVVNVGVDVLDFASPESLGMRLLKRRWLGFG